MALILLVDDAEDVIRPLQVVVGAEGYGVISAENGAVGFDLASRRLPDLIVTDWNMPVQDGEELCARLAHYPALSQIPIIVVSAFKATRSRDAWWNAFLRKPADPRELLRVIASLLSGRTKAGSTGVLSSRRPAVNPKCWP